MNEISRLTGKRGAPIKDLNDRSKEFVRLLVYGLLNPDDRLPDKPIGSPLTIAQAADVLGFTRRHARYLAEEPAIQAAIVKAVAMRRGNAAATVIDQFERIVASPVIEPKPSDIIAAGRALLGEEAKGFAVNVAVQTNVGTSDRPRAGYVIRLDRPRAQQAAASPNTIDHEPDNP